MTKFSLDQQIEEARREIAQRGEVYPRLVSKGQMRQSIADYHLERMRAILTTLEWLKRHEGAIRELRQAVEAP